MRTEAIKKAVTLGTELNNIFVATAAGNGLPHLAAAAGIRLLSEQRVAVEAWFCPGTLQNLETNRSISLVVWDEIGDTGYQLLGEVEEIKELSFMDGYLPKSEDREPEPQVERQLIVLVNKVVHFSHSPHSDVEE
jgi:hypothetical protein